VVGAGVIGLEVAATAATLGAVVTVIEAADRVMARSVSPAVSSFMAGYHRAKGVIIRCGTSLVGFSVEGGRGMLDLAGGERLAADVVIAGIGAEPVTELARDAGLLVDDGIVVDRFTRTSDLDIHAAGDAARFESVRHARHVRTEHWRHAIDQAEVAAQVMLGGTAHYEERPWVWSDQYDLNIQITGDGNGESEILRGKPEDKAFIAFQFRAGRLVGATTINQARFKRPIGDLVACDTSIDPATLADPATDLKKLAASLVKPA
jgi:3-phenylpropionate/trans-cinnamate dioxygenase ferredoxin reductase subunit